MNAVWPRILWLIDDWFSVKMTSGRTSLRPIIIKINEGEEIHISWINFWFWRKKVLWRNYCDVIIFVYFYEHPCLCRSYLPNDLRYHDKLFFCLKIRSNAKILLFHFFKFTLGGATTVRQKLQTGVVKMWSHWKNIFFFLIYSYIIYLYPCWTIMCRNK